MKIKRLFTFEEKMGSTLQTRIPCGNPNQNPLPDKEIRSATLVSNTFLIRKHIRNRDPTDTSMICKPPPPDRTSRCTYGLLVSTAMSTSLEDVVARFEADVLRRCRKPCALLKPDAQAERMAMVQRVTRALLNDDEVTITKTTTGEVVLRGGCFDSEQLNCDRMSEHDSPAVDILRTARSMKLSVRQMLKVRRHCSREQLLETRRGFTAYVATPVVVVGPAGKQRSAACAPLADLVLHQVKFAEDAGVLVVPLG